MSLEDPSRRRFLGQSLTTTVMIGSLGLAAAPLNGCSKAPEPATRAGDGAFHFLTREDITLLHSLLPVILGPALATDPGLRRVQVERTVHSLDASMPHYGAAIRGQIRELFDILNAGFTRITLARVWSPWVEASEEAINGFLLRWQESRFATFNMGYMALIQLSNYAFYSHPEHWASSHYPGPPKWAMEVLPQFPSPE